MLSAEFLDEPFGGAACFPNSWRPLIRPDHGTRAKRVVGAPNEACDFRHYDEFGHWIAFRLVGSFEPFSRWGERVEVRLPPELIAEIDRLALAPKRAQAIRKLIESGLDRERKRRARA